MGRAHSCTCPVCAAKLYLEIKDHLSLTQRLPLKVQLCVATDSVKPVKLHETLFPNHNIGAEAKAPSGEALCFLTVDAM